MVWCRIYSVFYYLGWTVLLLFLYSHPISRRRYAVVVYLLLPGKCGLVHTVRPVLRYHKSSVLVSRFLPASLHRRHNRLLLPCRLPSVFGFGRSLVFRLICHGVSRPICRICHRGLGGSVCFSGLSRRWYLVSSLFVISFRSEIMVPK